MRAAETVAFERLVGFVMFGPHSSSLHVAHCACVICAERSVCMAPETQKTYKKEVKTVPKSCSPNRNCWGSQFIVQRVDC